MLPEEVAMLAKARIQARPCSLTRSVARQLVALGCAALCCFSFPAQADRGQWTLYG